MDRLLDATAPLLGVAFTLGGSATTWLELAGVVLALWMVGCNMRVHPLGWPLAMLSSLIYALLFAHSRLYGEAALQLVFIAAAGWGWWQWLRGRGQDGARLVVHRLGRRAAWATAGLTLAAWPLLALGLARFTDADLPWWDALPTVGSLAGQFLLARKLVENWAVWLAVNLVSVALFSAKGLWLTAALYALFAGLSVAGWRAWVRLEGHVDARH